MNEIERENIALIMALNSLIGHTDGRVNVGGPVRPMPNIIVLEVTSTTFKEAKRVLEKAQQRIGY